MNVRELKKFNVTMSWVYTYSLLVTNLVELICTIITCFCMYY